VQKTSSEQLHASVADTELEPWAEPEPSSEADLLPAPAPARPPQAPTVSPADAPRRWPRRPTWPAPAPLASRTSRAAPSHELGAIVARADGPSRSGARGGAGAADRARPALL